MVTTTRRAAASAGQQQQQQQRARYLLSEESQSEHELQDRARTQRAPRRKVTVTRTAEITKRRTRSAKEGVSPLQALKSPLQKRKRATPATPVPVQVDHNSIQAENDNADGELDDTPAENGSTQVEDGIIHLDEDSSKYDAGEGIFFKSRKHQAHFFKSKVRTLEARIAELESFESRRVAEHEARHGALEARYDILEAYDATLKARNTELEARNTALEARNAALEARNAALEARNAALEQELERCLDFISMTDEVVIDPSLTDIQPAEGNSRRPPAEPVTNQQPQPSAPIVQHIHEPVVEGSERALALLKKIEDNRKAGWRAQPQEDQVEAPAQTLQASPQIPNPIASPAETPLQLSFFDKMVSVLTSPFSASRATPPHTVVSPERLPQPTAIHDTPPTPSLTPQELTLSLTPTPTPVGERRIKPRIKRRKNNRNAMSKVIANSVQDPNEQSEAQAWAMEVLAKFPNGSVALGEKRKRLDVGIKVGELKHIPGTKPWKSGGYGIDDDLFDLSDSEQAPAWAVLHEIMMQEQEDNQPPSKKRKSVHNGDTEETSELSGVFFNSKGNTASLEDLRPRSSRIGSPMFESSATHQEGSNVFHELDEQTPTQQSSAEKRAAFDRELRRTGHVAGSGSFCVPEGDSDEDESMEDTSTDEARDSTLWTQQPPPAPVPAHASLPSPVAENASVTENPSVSASSLDPIESQRVRLMKHTPAKPSRLREVHVPSPSLRSDAGDESFIGGSPLRIAGYDLSDMPQAEPLDFPEAQGVEDWAATDDGRAYLEGSSWDDAVVVFSDCD
jgi:hypothetical protein